MSDALQQALATAGVTYLVYLRQQRNKDQIMPVFELALAVANNAPIFGAVLVDVGDLTPSELALIGPVTDVDAALLSRGPGLDRMRLATYHLNAVDDPLEMIVAWGLDR